MKYRTHNDEHINAAGTSHKADITTTYSKLVELFGEPRKASACNYLPPSDFFYFGLVLYGKTKGLDG